MVEVELLRFPPQILKPAQDKRKIYPFGTGGAGGRPNTPPRGGNGKKGGKK